MTTFLLVIHLIVCFFLIFIVLIQSGKGAEVGAAFGGSSQTMFGARGAATFFSKLTTTAAVVFMLTSLTLSILTTKTGPVIKAPTPATTEQQKNLPPEPGPVQTEEPSQPAGGAIPADSSKPSG
ncbi:MAG: preprotein translocase subunit SecG [Nitrospirota bacterium]|nr:preprotein translocase subunit SecG [Nitrospirota bacterium]